MNKVRPYSVWNQQKAKLLDNSDDRCPRLAYTQDLVAEIRKWKEESDQIVVALDANEDVRSGPFASAMRTVGLTEAITHRHGLEGPETSKTGTDPIDGIFVSSTLLGCKCGYLGYNFNHRSLWIDIPYTAAFGHKVPAIVKAKARRLKLMDPRTVKKFQAFLEAFLIKHKLNVKAKMLQASASSFPISKSNANKWERYDDLRRQGQQAAEKRCRKLNMGEVDWSPAYQCPKDKAEALTYLLKRNKGQNVSSSIVLRKLKQTGQEQWLQASMEEIIEQRLAAYRDLKQAKLKPRENRDKHLEKLAEAKEAAGETTKAQFLCSYKCIEYQRKEARMIKQCNHDLRSGSITSVIAPHPQTGIRTEFTGKEDIERAALSENERRFNQATDNAFLKEPLLSDVGELGTGPASEAILNGTYLPPLGTDPHVTLLIKHMQRVPGAVNGPPNKITQEQYVQGWAKQKERTSSGPSGMHFGQTKAGALNRVIADFEAKITSIPYTMGFLPNDGGTGLT